MRERPTFVPIWLQCRLCRYSWDDWQPSGVSLATGAAHLSTLRCPQCEAGAHDVLLRTKPLEGPAQ